MRNFFRKRNYILIGGSLFVLLFQFFTDPNGGAITATWLGQLATPIVAVWFSYLASTAIFDSFDIGELYSKAKQSAVGAALMFVGVCIVVFGLLGLFGSSARAQGVTTYIPAKAHVYLPIVQAEQYRLWPEHPKDI